MDHWRDATMTRSEVLRVGMRAIREGLGEDKYLLSFPPGVIGGPYLDALRVGDDTAPIWRKSEGKWAWGCRGRFDQRGATLLFRALPVGARPGLRVFSAMKAFANVGRWRTGHR